MSWIIKSADGMNQQQDNLTHPLTSAEKDTYSQRVKELGAGMIANCVPYDGPAGSHPIEEIADWVRAAKAQGLKVWHRHSWCSDKGWYGIAKNTTNNRIADTKAWILAHPDFFQSGDIFTPMAEPQNAGVAGINADTPYRFASVSAFNVWLRDMMVNCKQAFAQLGLDVKVGYWGFDGFVTVGYDNADWEGKSFLEPATVAAMDNIITVDHYPSSKPMSDFLRVFKIKFPGVKLVAGEYGATQSGDAVAQVTAVLNDLKNDPIVIGVNYWQMGPAGNEALLMDGFGKRPAFDVVKSFFTESAPQPDPQPDPNTGHAEIIAKLTSIEGKIDTEIANIQAVETKLSAAKGIVWGTGTTAAKISKLKTLLPQ